MSAVFHPGKINSYKPIVSDVSDNDLVETVKQIEKSENVIAPTPGLACMMPFDVSKQPGVGDLVPLGNLSNHHTSISLTP